MNEDTVTVDTDETEPTYLNDEIVDGVSGQLADAEVENQEAAILWAVDVTLRSVVEWLRREGHSDAADDLESFGGV